MEITTPTSDAPTTEPVSEATPEATAEVSEAPPDILSPTVLEPTETLSSSVNESENTATWTLVVEDDFDTRDTSGWTVSSGWAFAPQPAGYALRVFNNTGAVRHQRDGLYDVAASADFLTEYGTANLSIRHSPAGDYTASLTHDGLVTLTPGAVRYCKQRQWQTLRLEAVHQTVSVFVDGVVAIVYEDARTIPAGAVLFFGTFAASSPDVTPVPPLNTLHVDNFQVWIASNADEPVLPLLPTETPMPAIVAESPTPVPPLSTPIPVLESGESSAEVVDPIRGCQRGGRLDCSSLEVTAYCDGTISVFIITNTDEPGNGDMVAPTEYRFYVEGDLFETGEVLLDGGETMEIRWEWGGEERLEADQQIGHPGISHPRETLYCGPLINIPPQVNLDTDNSGGLAPNYATTFIEDSSGVPIGDDVSIIDPTDLTMQSATLVLAPRPDGASEYLFVDTAASGVTATYIDGVLTLNGTAAVSVYETLLASVQYVNLSQNPDSQPRTVTVTVYDGVWTSTPVISTISVIPVNDAPVVTVGGYAACLCGRYTSGIYCKFAGD